MRHASIAWIVVVCLVTGVAWAERGGHGHKRSRNHAAAMRKRRQGLRLEKAGDFRGAVAKYKQAWKLSHNAHFWRRIARAERRRGDRDDDLDAYRAAVAAYKQFLEHYHHKHRRLVRITKDDIAKLEALIEKREKKGQAADEEPEPEPETAAKAKPETAGKPQPETAAKAKPDAATGAPRKAASPRGHRRVAVADKAGSSAAEVTARRSRSPKVDRGGAAVDVVVVGGLDEDMSGVGRFLAGLLYGWGHLALEGHLVLEGFQPMDETRGLKGRSMAVDLGARLSLSDDSFRGAFLALGSSFGLYLGRPRRRTLVDDPTTCTGFDTLDTPGSCRFDVSMNAAGRAALGYGFGIGDSTSMALRIEATYWLFAVDSTQRVGSVPAPRVEKPQHSLSLSLGLELMRF